MEINKKQSEIVMRNLLVISVLYSYVGGKQI